MNQTLRAADLDPSWLNTLRSTKVLSLDCFDTILWRKVAEPIDVFYELANSSEFKRHSLTAPLRVKAESSARNKKWVQAGETEVNLEEIYREALPHVSQQEIDALVEQELACESQNLFAFRPVFELIQEAKARGLRIIVVSDTYFSAAHLKRLLFSAAPSLESLIDDLFCSSDYRKSKVDGIWTDVVRKLNAPPDTIWHLGDNLSADFLAPRKYGIHATHLVHQIETVSQVLEQRTQAASQFLPQIRYTAPIPSLFHGQFSENASIEDPAEIIGYASVGPVLYAFAEFILSEKRRLEAEGRSVKLAFLLRDGYLPSLACAQLAGSIIGGDASVTRFTAIAASLRDREDVINVLSTSLATDYVSTVIRQLLIPPALAQDIKHKIRNSAQPERELSRIVLQEKILSVIFKQSAEFRRRLFAHLNARIGLSRGDTLIFVDLGYSGTVQTRLQSVLQDEFGIALHGCYLLSAETPHSRSSRRGLIDSCWLDDRAITALTRHIAIFEMLCTQRSRTTVDYTAEGEPILAEGELPSTQHDAAEQIQAACLKFIRDYRELDPIHKPRAHAEQLAHSATIDLARLIYFPTAAETTFLKSFRFDLNLGTDRELALFDPESGLISMRRQGFAYMKADISSTRMSYPLELRHIDIALSSLLLSQNRFGFGVTPTNASYRKEKVQVLIANETEHTTDELTAHSTHDGFFSLFVPVSGSFNVAVLLGRNYSWIQIDSIEFVDRSKLTNSQEMVHDEDFVLDGIEHHENGLCSVEAQGMLYLAGTPRSNNWKMCRIVFRPISVRQAEDSATTQH